MNTFAKKARQSAGKAVKVLTITAAVAVTTLFSSCAFFSHKGNEAYKAISLGDSEENAIETFDLPFHSQLAGTAYGAYTSDRCENPCVKRLWFFNRASLTGEAWSVDINKKGRVISKYYWSSP